MPDREPWPLSAAATQVLRQPRVAAGIVLRLALQELVATGAWTLHRERRRLRTTVVVLRRGSEPVPDRVPLPLLDRQLRAVVPPGPGLPLRGAVEVVTADRQPQELRTACHDDLVARELLQRVPRRWWLDGWRRVSDEDGLERELDRRQAGLRTALAAGGTRADSALQDADLALLLLLGRRRLRTVDRAVAAARGRGVEITLVHGGEDGLGGIGGLESLCELADVVSAVEDSVGTSGDADGGGGD